MTLVRSAGTRCVRAALGGVLVATFLGAGVSGVAAQSPAASVGPDGSAAAAYPTELITPPGEATLDVSYPEWAAAWLTWVLSAPASANPMLVDACSGQDSAVYFIPQTVPGSTLATYCQTYGDQWLLNAGGIVYCDTIEHPGATDEELAACVQDGKGTYSDVSVTIDGQPIADLDGYWVTTTPFDLALPEDNVLGVPAQETHAVGGGWFVMVQPLAPGVHTVVIRDESTAPDGGDSLVAEVTATVEVIP